MINPVWLNTFKTLVETGSFTKAAEKLFMTQPGVSQHVQKLELACKHLLLKRINKSFELTEQGELVYQYAIQAAQNEATFLDTLNENKEYKGVCRLGCSGALALVLYPQLLRLQQKHPELVIHLEAAPNRNILTAIKSSVLDLAVVTNYPENGQFYAEAVGEEVLSLIVPKTTHRFKSPIQQLNQLGLIRHPDVDHYLSLYFTHSGVKELVDKNTESFKTAGYVNQINQILAPVAAGLGFTVLPKSTLKNFAERERLAVFEAPNAVTEPLFLVRKRHRQMPKRFETISTLIRQSLTL
ncbi:LysR family transcriptional regulator [Gayadomonas joobiniege]|uniref:LysR family transcriptional regulator n=1 Tax=Gayadomonas joobiniege TaxID=1234606 RepID=UPI0003605615|nr:LysR family transcriptional regulator [Gayadomonas joobiniege]